MTSLVQRSMLSVHSNAMVALMRSLARTSTSIRSIVPLAIPSCTWSSRGYPTLNLSKIESKLSSLSGRLTMSPLICLGIDIRSKDIEVRNLHGTSVLYLGCKLASTCINLFLYKDIDKSTDKSPLCIGGTAITLLHPTDPTLHAPY